MLLFLMSNLSVSSVYAILKNFIIFIVINVRNDIKNTHKKKTSAVLFIILFTVKLRCFKIRMLNTVRLNLIWPIAEGDIIQRKKTEMMKYVS